MILAIDAGNTNISIGLIENGQVVIKCNILTQQNQQLQQELQQFSALNVQGCIISSVVPDLIPTLEAACETLAPALIVHAPGVHIPLQTAGIALNTIGADLIACAVATIDKYPGPALILDMGTATTLTYINHKGEFAGVAIAPGLELAMLALNKSTALLPAIPLIKPPTIIGTDTISALQGGIYYGYCGLVNTLIKQAIKEINQPLKVIATGGLVNKIQDDIETLDIIDEDLAFYGLEIIYKRNN